MLSDESSSDSETGRFKCRTKSQDNQSSNQKSDNTRGESGGSRQPGNDRFNRNYDRRREERERFVKHPRDRDRDRGRDRNRFSGHSSVNRRPSRDRSSNRKSHERNRHRESSDRSKPRDHRSNSKDRHKHSRSRSYISHDNRNVVKEDLKYRAVRSKSPDQLIKKSREKTFSPEHRSKRSEVYKPPPLAVKKATDRKKSVSPIVIDENDHSDTEVQLGSYYNMIPAIVKDVKKPDESTEIDSSDDERLRAKLLKRDLQESKRQKKHKKKHKRKSSKSSKDREFNESSVSVEVTSTTDIKMTPDVPDVQPEIVEEVSSTQKIAQTESCEEGEISSDDSQINIDPTDLRHKLRHSAKSGTKVNSDICGPALPPHLNIQYKGNASPETEGPALPPHLQSKNLGPSIPDHMRKVLAERGRDVITYESSDEDSGIGPLPAGSEEKWSDAHRRLEERALDIKIKNLDGYSKTKVKSREKWMLELPEGKAKYIGLEARSFRAKEGPDMSDRTSWTDTPEEKARKATGQVREADLDQQLKEEARMRHITNRDEEQESSVKKHKKKHKRDESLLEIHQKKLKKKKKKEEKDEGKKERRPFSRDVDLQVNRFDEAQKKSIIKKAQDLNSRFGKGEAKYL